MRFYIYAFGSICRGEVSPQSDIDLLAVVEAFDARFNPHQFSIYSPTRLLELWCEGNPFAWHLHSESKLLFTSDGVDLIFDLGQPANYLNAERDCYKFHSLFAEAMESFIATAGSRIFDLSTMFLSIRNFATCFQLGVNSVRDFSRNSAKRLGKDSVPISEGTFTILLRSRILATRGIGEYLRQEETQGLESDLKKAYDWMGRLRYDAFGSAGVQ